MRDNDEVYKFYGKIDYPKKKKKKDSTMDNITEQKLKIKP